MLERKNITKLLGMGSLCLLLLGCSEESFLVQQESSTVILEEEVVVSQKEDEDFNLLPKDGNGQGVTGSEDAGREAAIGKNNSQADSSNDADVTGSRGVEEEVAVHICGAVNRPGVYYFKNNQRLYEAIQKAGGFREDADQDYLNQAMVLEDGMKIVVPTEEETDRIKRSEDILMENEDDSMDKGKNYIQTEVSSDMIDQGFIQKENVSDETESKSGKVDLNTADVALLCTLPGIGESRAKSIIAYREEHGPFQKTEDVMNVSGIKEAAFKKIKDYVMVSR